MLRVKRNISKTVSYGIFLFRVRMTLHFLANEPISEAPIRARTRRRPTSSHPLQMAHAGRRPWRTGRQTFQTQSSPKAWTAVLRASNGEVVYGKSYQRSECLLSYSSLPSFGPTTGINDAKRTLSQPYASELICICCLRHFIRHSISCWSLRYPYVFTMMSSVLNDCTGA